MNETVTSSKRDISIEQYALRSRELTTQDFDAKNKEQLGIALGNLQKILVVKNLIVTRGCDFSGEAGYHAFALTKSALDFLISALHLARQRAVTEMMCLLRMSLESASTAIHIFNNSEAFEHYSSNRYHSTRAISFAKQFIPMVGEYWGILSENAVHTNALGHGARLRTGSDGKAAFTVLLEYGARDHQPVQDKVSLTMISLIANIVLKMTELILFEVNSAFEGTLQLRGTKTVYISNTDQKVMEYDRELQAFSNQGQQD
jgi:hypothetical protein